MVLTMNDLAVMGKENTISSLEVAEMIGKRHDNLLSDIREYIKEFSLLNFKEREYFKESTYKNRGRDYPCYEITKKGCEFIAHKLTGIKGTEFTVKYIDRFHDMEDYIQSQNQTMLISFKEQVQSLDVVADMLHMNEASKLLMLENFYKDYNIPTGFLPKYEHNGSRKMKALSTLLKENGCDLSAQKFNILLIEKGYLEERERKSSKSDGIKKFKALTEKGLRYGENAVNPHNQREVQPLYYSDNFMELYGRVIEIYD